MENGLSASDVALMSRSNDGGFGFGGDGAWIFGLLVLLGLFNGGFGGFGGNRAPIMPNGEPVTESGLCNAMNFNNLENAVGRLSDSLSNDYMGLQNGICNLGYETLRNFNTTQQQLAECCCTTQRGIDAVNYNGAINTAAINANTTAQTQKILDAISGNRMADMQSQINQLQLQAALCGIPRTSPYGYGVVPSFATTCTGCGTCGYSTNV